MIKIIITTVFMFSSLSAQGALVSRLGGQAVYDTDSNITWLSNANAGAGSVYDNGVSATDGLMTWANAKAWTESLTIGGSNNWRLPMGDLNCSGFKCTNSEMGHLFYNELGGVSGISILSSSDPDLSLFSNIGSENYWSSTEIPSNLTLSLSFRFNTGASGQQGGGEKSHELFAWAVHSGDISFVHSGDISLVPIPPAVWLFGSSLIGLLGFNRYVKCSVFQKRQLSN